MSNASTRHGPPGGGSFPRPPDRGSSQLVATVRAMSLRSVLVVFLHTAFKKDEVAGEAARDLLQHTVCRAGAVGGDAVVSPPVSV
mmetsp:Transcript_112373/g.312357  ORF Transcript_112373/g.312357 Transcript_112373/m.312357 type:complete len:85 (-) Transcript_112373:121-375(-)